MKRSVRFASLLVCALWVVSLAGYFEGEHAGFHTIQDSRTIVFTESDVDFESDILSRSISCNPADPAGAGFPFPDGSMNPPQSRPSLFPGGIGRSHPAGKHLIATAVLRP